MPNCNDVYELYIGLDGDAYVEQAPEYKYSKPFVYYGSSVTQGGCASRAGTTIKSPFRDVLSLEWTFLSENVIKQRICTVTVAYFWTVRLPSL